MEHAAVLELVGRDPVTGAVRALRQRHALGLRLEQVRADVAAAVRAVQAVLAQARADGDILLRKQQTVVRGIAEHRLRDADRTRLAGIAEGAGERGLPATFGALQVIPLEALVQFGQRRRQVLVLRRHVVVADDHLVGVLLRTDPQAVRLLQVVRTEHEQRREVRQLEDLNAPVVALDHQHQVVDHRDTVRPLHLAQRAAWAGHGAQLLTRAAVVDDQAVRVLGGGDQPARPIGRAPTGRRIDVLRRRRGGDEGFRHHDVGDLRLAQQRILLDVLVGLFLARRRLCHRVGCNRRIGLAAAGGQQEREGKQDETWFHRVPHDM